jgi:ribose/xylose/arabinose/galactoside ABC-type transport system permease subunit
VLAQTRFGKYTTAIGGNEETAKLAGISVKGYKLGIYALGGLLTGVASALLTARLSSADPTAGTFYELDAIAATVMGGTSQS